jgi:arginyl-tRNA synthetase
MAYIHPKRHLESLFLSALQDVAPDMAVTIELTRTKQKSHGDYASNLAMQLAKSLRRNPRELAGLLLRALPDSDLVERAEVAGSGFVNIFLKPLAWQRLVRHILEQGERYGRSDSGKGTEIQIEFVSANPTGPLHVGHGRGAAYGASLANVLSAAGYDVQREYYVNDAGRQMDILTVSTWLRYLQLCGEEPEFPSNGYQGDYVRSMAGAIHQLHGEKYRQPATKVMANCTDVPGDAEARLDIVIENAKRLLGPDYAYFHDYALTEQLADCRADLREFGVEFDVWFSEKSLYDNGLVERAVKLLEDRGHLYKQDGAMWFRSTAFGDEKDRVVRRDNGQYTYFASDIAYHLNKFERGFEQVIDVWGADHHGYIPRVKGALRALDQDAEKLTVSLVQFAVLYRGEQKAPMSTRAGEYVTLRDLRAEAGNDAARFFYVLRRADQHLDFDLDLAKSRGADNPVYYVQYAHARLCSVLQAWGGREADLLDHDGALLSEPHELDLLTRLMAWPEAAEAAARELSPHLIAYYLRDLASDLHTYYNSTHFLVNEKRLRIARLALVAATRRVLRSGLELLGVSAPESM